MIGLIILRHGFMMKGKDQWLESGVVHGPVMYRGLLAMSKDRQL